MPAASDQVMNMLVELVWEERATVLQEKVSELEQRLASLENSHRRTYLRQKEVRERFGIGHTTLKGWVNRGLREIWIDNRVYYDINDIEAYLEQHKI